MKLQTAKFHFVGVGGIGMCGLAELLHNMGAKVSGSDISENANTERLKELGVKVFKGHAASNVGDADVVVYSSAIQYGNPEISEARARQIPLMPRAEALAEIMRSKRGIAVAGTHGKTTTTSMTTAIFLEANLSPTIVVGGRLELIKSTAILGSGEWLIAEADESDGSFHKLSPEVAIITNIDSDHLDHFKTFENLQKNFHDFALRIPFYGKVIVCGDDPIVRQVFENFPKRILFYGFEEKNDLVISGEQGKYSIHRSDRLLGTKHLVGEFKLNVPGRHNALNATAAICAGMAAGIPFAVCAKGLQRYEGVDRRFHYKGEKRGIKVYDDYGHHPTEVRAVMQAFREKFPQQRLVVFFQPHRYSRTEHCWHDFTTAFKDADQVLLTDIYPAGESPIPGVTSERLAQEMKHENAQYFVRDEKATQKILSTLKEGDVFITLGAGDGWKLGLDVLNNL
ncbi:UDP-N-acetylmuramate--L-alanine ligase [Bdellovibrio bacteriovorus]|uniref:UDP-N-acetylmuramate--L-alanine ligase n=1 Tax=Bdellovibrio bacteriovorus TaxID=959 RepID=A0A150WP24_BDEBC|nr:UDP-N-acetylmuramate--L-alanine ligase [Bdellovibrio bacteriovorus]KYG66057.1 UDP-N-acetylmuramate--L-alanine ligase [Bdellovibrio bacteriovorus]